MRITLTIDDDLADALSSGRSCLVFRSIRSSTRRCGAAWLRRRPRTGRCFVCGPFRSGFRPGIDPLKLNQLNDELEVQDFLEKHPDWPPRT